MTARRWSVVLLAAALAACSTPAPEPAPEPSPTPTSRFTFPGADWQRVDPASAGFDAARLADVDETLAADDTACFVVVRDGVVVHESYGDGLDASTTRAVFSVTKSLTSLITGIAVDEGDLALDDSAAQYVPQWQGTPAADVTVRNLLANDSGRQWDYRTDYEQMAFAEDDKTAFAIGLEQTHPPGEVWNYNNSAIQTMSAVLEEATGNAAGPFAVTRLFRPLQMASTRWGVDATGNSTTFAGVTSSCLDLARVGYLMMRDGEWDGKQIVSPGYVREAVGQPSTDLNAAYGLQWWVNDTGTIRGALAAQGTAADPPREGQLAPTAPDDAFWALGFGRQIVAVVPSEGVVAVRLGAMPADGGLQPEEFTRLVLDAQTD